MGFEALHVFPDFMENNGKATAFCKWALDVFSDNVLNAAIFPKGVGFEGLKDLEEFSFFSRFGKKLSGAINLG